MRYYLMNKDTPVLEFEIVDKTAKTVRFSNDSFLPYGYRKDADFDINSWLKSRKIAEHREKIKKLIQPKIRIIVTKLQVYRNPCRSMPTEPCFLAGRKSIVERFAYNITWVESGDANMRPFEISVNVNDLRNRNQSRFSAYCYPAISKHFAVQMSASFGCLICMDLCLSQFL